MVLRRLTSAITALILGLTMQQAQAANNYTLVVLELFTSQSCSSCPPADALLKRLSESDHSLIALSYHVDYWDYLSWKDTYSSPAGTQRQRDYAQVLGGGVFTPELVVGGLQAMVGSNESDVTAAIAKAKKMASPLAISITPKAGKLEVNLTSSAVQPVELWEIRFDRYAKTPVKAGENGGRVLESINNVTHITNLGLWAKQPIAIEPLQGDGIAILAQAPNHGPILGAASYLKP